MTLWLTVAAVAAASAAIKAAGPAVFAGRELPHGARRILTYLAPALLAALIAVQTFTAAKQLVLDARALGLAVTGAALVARAPALLAVALAASVTALARALL